MRAASSISFGTWSNAVFISQVPSGTDALTCARINAHGVSRTCSDDTILKMGMINRTDGNIWVASMPAAKSESGQAVPGEYADEQTYSHAAEADDDGVGEPGREVAASQYVAEVAERGVVRPQRGWGLVDLAAVF